jgi:transcriptional regulator with XRE-family HTH domain
MLDTMRQLRKKKGITMKELGEQVGVAEITISTYETGKQEPSLDVLCKLADVLDVSLDMLVRGKEKDRPEGRSLEETARAFNSLSDFV